MAPQGSPLFWRNLKFTVLLLAAVQALAGAEHHGVVTFGGLPVPGATVTASQGEKRLTAVTDPQGAREVQADKLPKLTLPTMPGLVTPLVYAIPVQLIAYHTAVVMGTDVDQPRNLAKSVTVE